MSGFSLCDDCNILTEGCGGAKLLSSQWLGAEQPGRGLERERQSPAMVPKVAARLHAQHTQEVLYLCVLHTTKGQLSSAEPVGLCSSDLRGGLTAFSPGASPNAPSPGRSAQASDGATSRMWRCQDLLLVLYNAPHPVMTAGELCEGGST